MPLVHPTRHGLLPASLLASGALDAEKLVELRGDFVGVGIQRPGDLLVGSEHAGHSLNGVLWEFDDEAPVFEVGLGFVEHLLVDSVDEVGVVLVVHRVERVLVGALELGEVVAVFLFLERIGVEVGHTPRYRGGGEK